jgi:hypothetical protein
MLNLNLNLKINFTNNSRFLDFGSNKTNDIKKIKIENKFEIINTPLVIN